MNGKWIWWNENGNKIKEGSYIKGNGTDIDSKFGSPLNGRHGIWTLWSENGKKRYEETYNDGKIVFSIEWYEWFEQKKSEKTFKGWDVVSEKYWNKDGSVKE